MENLQIYPRALRCTPDKGIVQADETQLFKLIHDCHRRIMAGGDKQFNLAHCERILRLCRRKRYKDGEAMVRLAMERYNLTA